MNDMIDETMTLGEETGSRGGDGNSSARSGQDDEPDYPDANANDWQHNVQDFAHEARIWIADHPFAALGVAVAAGFLVGRIKRR